MVISDDARRIQVETFKILYASYILQKMRPQDAAKRALDEAAYGAVVFDKRFPSATTVDVTPPAVASAPSEPSEEEILTGWAPGVSPPPELQKKRG